MRIGFSTGAIARGNYLSALKTLRDSRVQAVELSALRLSELAPLVRDPPHLDLTHFSFVSFHAPSSFKTSQERRVLEMLRTAVSRRIPVVVHPDTISDFALWREFGRFLFVENMDNRKSTGRTASEMAKIFDQLPDAGFCFDIGHSRQIDPTMMESIKLMKEHAIRLKEVHMSDVDASGQHGPMSPEAVQAFQDVSRMIPHDVPVILETLIDLGQSDLETEISKAELALNTASPLRSSRQDQYDS